jgi:hypothetical protein
MSWFQPAGSQETTSVTALNDVGQLVLVTQGGMVSRSEMVNANGTRTQVPALTGYETGTAGRSINNAGQVVGQSFWTSTAWTSPGRRASCTTLHTAPRRSRAKHSGTPAAVPG